MLKCYFSFILCTFRFCIKYHISFFRIYNAVVFIPNEKILYPYWTNKSIISGLISYLRTKEGWSDIPTILSNWTWSVMRINLLNAYSISTSYGAIGTSGVLSVNYVALASAL